MRRGDGLIDNGLCLCRVGIKPVIDVLVDRALHKAFDLGVAQLGLGLTLELRVAHLDRNNGGQAFAAVIAGKVAVLVLDELVLLGIAVHQGGQGCAEALFVRAALVGIDGIGKGVHGLLIALVPLQGHLNLVVLAFCLEGHDGGVNGALGLIEEFYVVRQALRVVEGDLLAALLIGLGDVLGVGFLVKGIAGIGHIIKGCLVRARLTGFRIGDFLELDLLLGHALINKLDGQALVQEGHLLQAARNGVVIELGGFKDLRIRPEANLGTGAAGVTAFYKVIRNGVLEVLVPVLALTLDLRLHAGG